MNANTTLSGLLADDVLDLEAIAAVLDGAGSEERTRLIRNIGGRAQARLWAAAEGRSTSIADVVGEGIAPATEVRHLGKNSLPLFSHFEKRFCRVEGDPGTLYGFNEGSTRPLIGPGYFVAGLDAGRGEVAIDYLRVPPEGAKLPPGWPAVRINERGLSRFVFAGMVDYLRRISKHVTIGQAWRGGKETANTFLLARNDPAR